jgi:hypothetical protein
MEEYETAAKISVQMSMDALEEMRTIGKWESLGDMFAWYYTNDFDAFKEDMAAIMRLDGVSRDLKKLEEKTGVLEKRIAKLERITFARDSPKSGSSS